MVVASHNLKWMDIQILSLAMNRWRHPLIVKWFGDFVGALPRYWTLSEVNVHSHALAYADKDNLEWVNFILSVSILPYVKIIQWVIPLGSELLILEKVIWGLWPCLPINSQQNSRQSPQTSFIPFCQWSICFRVVFTPLECQQEQICSLY